VLASIYYAGIKLGENMKAVICKEWAKPEELSFEEFPDLEAGDGEVVIAVKACAGYW